MTTVTGRFAPSPTGPLHLGNLRTALAAWLFTRSEGGRFLLRIDDLDRARHRPEHEPGQLTDLSSIDIDWDETPLRQSERSSYYCDALCKLRAQGRVYPCWCSRAEIALVASAPHNPPGNVYPGTCRELSKQQRADRERELGPPRAFRLDAHNETIEFTDLLRGTFTGEVDDFVVWRGDGLASYHLATVVDDACQGIDQIVRGEDLLENTPRQILLGRLLRLKTPDYAHIPLVLGPSGQRLAKRDGAVTLQERLQLGESVASIVGWMGASLGLIDWGQPATAADLLACFERSRISASPTFFSGDLRPV
jgi:glutamyl-tRNA synthetase